MSPSPTGEESALGFRIDRGEVDATTDTTFLSSGNAEEEDLEDGEVIDDGPPEPEFTVLQELSGWSVPEISKTKSYVIPTKWRADGQREAGLLHVVETVIKGWDEDEIGANPYWNPAVDEAQGWNDTLPHDQSGRSPKSSRKRGRSPSPNRRTTRDRSPWQRERQQESRNSSCLVSPTRVNDVPVGWAEDLYVSVSNSGQDTEVSGQSEPVPETPSISLNSTAFRRVLNGVMEHNAALSAGIHPSRLRALSEAPEPQRGDGCETRTPYAVTGSNAIGFDTPFLSSSGTPTSGNPVNASTSTIAISDIPPAGVHPSRLKLLSEPFEPPREDHETARVPFVVTGANAIGFDLISPSVVDGLASSSREKSSLLRSRRGKERNKGWDLPAPGEDLSTTKVITSTWDSDADQGWGGSSDATKITESPVRERSRQVQPRRENNDFNWNADFVPLPQEARQIPLPGSGWGEDPILLNEPQSSGWGNSASSTVTVKQEPSVGGGWGHVEKAPNVFAKREANVRHRPSFTSWEEDSPRFSTRHNESAESRVKIETTNPEAHGWGGADEPREGSALAGGWGTTPGLNVSPTSANDSGHKSPSASRRRERSPLLSQRPSSRGSSDPEPSGWDVSTSETPTIHETSSGWGADPVHTEPTAPGGWDVEPNYTSGHKREDDRNRRGRSESSHSGVDHSRREERAPSMSRQNCFRSGGPEPPRHDIIPSGTSPSLSNATPDGWGAEPVSGPKASSSGWDIEPLQRSRSTHEDDRKGRGRANNSRFETSREERSRSLSRNTNSRADSGSEPGWVASSSSTEIAATSPDGWGSAPAPTQSKVSANGWDSESTFSSRPVREDRGRPEMRRSDSRTEERPWNSRNVESSREKQSRSPSRNASSRMGGGAEPGWGATSSSTEIAATSPDGWGSAPAPTQSKVSANGWDSESTFSSRPVREDRGRPEMRRSDSRTEERPWNSRNVESSREKHSRSPSRNASSRMGGGAEPGWGATSSSTEIAATSSDGWGSAPAPTQSKVSANGWDSESTFSSRPVREDRGRPEMRRSDSRTEERPWNSHNVESSKEKQSRSPSRNASSRMGEESEPGWGATNRTTEILNTSPEGWGSDPAPSQSNASANGWDSQSTFSSRPVREDRGRPEMRRSDSRTEGNYRREEHPRSMSRNASSRSADPHEVSGWDDPLAALPTASDIPGGWGSDHAQSLAPTSTGGWDAEPPFSSHSSKCEAGDTDRGRRDSSHFNSRPRDRSTESRREKRPRSISRKASTRHEDSESSVWGTPQGTVSTSAPDGWGASVTKEDTSVSDTVTAGWGDDFIPCPQSSGPHSERLHSRNSDMVPEGDMNKQSHVLGIPAGWGAESSSSAQPSGAGWDAEPSFMSSNARQGGSDERNAYNDRSSPGSSIKPKPLMDSKGRFKQAFQTSAQTSVVYQCPSTPPSGWGASVFDSKNTESEGWESKDSGSRVKYEYKEEARTVNRRDSSSAESGWGADPQLDGKSTQGWSSAASSPRRDNHHVSSSFSNDNGWGGPASSGHSPSKDANHGTGSWGAVPSGHCGKPESYGWGGAPPTDRQSSWSQQNDDSAPVIDTSWDAPYDSGPSVKSEWGTSVSRSSPTRNNLSTSGDWGYTPDPSDGWNSGGNEIRVKAEAPPPIDLTDDPKNPKDPRRKNKSRSATDQQQTQDVKLSPMRSTASYNEAPESAIRLESSPDKKRRYSTYGRQGLDRLDPESPLASPSRPYTMVFPEIRPTVTPFRTRMPGFDFSSVVKVKKERKPL